MTPATFAALAVGPFVGSLVALVAERYARGEGFVAGRSHCNGCGRVLSPIELIPVVSWLALRGRARCCGTPVPVSLPLTELAAFAVPAMSLVAGAQGAALWASCVLGWTLLVLALIDLRTWTLPDALTLPLLLAGLGLAATGVTGPLLDHAIGAGVGWGGLAGIAALFRAWRGYDGLGLGDAKLFGAAGAWLGWAALPTVLLAACLAGLALALVLRGRHEGRRAIPFGPALAAGIWAVWLLA